MRFTVPQNLDTEDTILGPLSFKQVVYLVGGGGLVFVLFNTLPTFFAILSSLPAAGFSLLLAFYKPNDRPFVLFFQSMTTYFLKKKLYIWKKTSPEDKIQVRGSVQEVVAQNRGTEIEGGKISEKSSGVDVGNV